MRNVLRGKAYQLIAASLTVLSSCQAGGLSRAVRPDAPDAASAVGAADCHPDADTGQPLVVDWKGFERVNLEDAMRNGVAVLAYDCKRPRVLTDCQLEGSYSFSGVTPKQEVLHFVDTDELRANLNLHASAIGLNLGAEMSRGVTLDLAMVLVGKRNATVRVATRDSLRGSCSGATHFVRGAFVGAFSFGTGTRGRVSTTADIFAAGGAAEGLSIRLSNTRDGDPSACATADTTATSPPRSCSAVLRLELVRIDADLVGRSPDSQTGSGLAFADNQRIAMACPAGFVRASGKCAKPAPAMAWQCKGDDLNECREQCDRGDMASCFMAGTIYERGNAQGDAVRAFERGCTGGYEEACVSLAWQIANNTQQEAQRAFRLLQNACGTANASACNGVGVSLFKGRGVQKDEAEAIKLFGRACRMGDLLGCLNLERRDPKASREGIEAACSGGLGEACMMLAHSEKSVATRVAYLRKACHFSSSAGCSEASTLLRFGAPGLQADLPLAQTLSKQRLRLVENGCAAGDPWLCGQLANMFEVGDGVPRDSAKALQLYTRACGVNIEVACNGLKRVRERQ